LTEKAFVTEKYLSQKKAIRQCINHPDCCTLGFVLPLARGVEPYENRDSYFAGCLGVDSAKSVVESAFKDLGVDVELTTRLMKDEREATSAPRRSWLMVRMSSLIEDTRN
jgi:hypothetical protein